MSPKVSIIMTVYNAVEYLSTAIGSVLAQTFEDWELLIYDDGSTDGTVHDVYAMLGVIDHPKIRLHLLDPSEPERRATARYATLINHGVDEARGEFVTFLCGDDFFEADRLARMVPMLEHDAAIVYGEQRLLRPDGGQFGVRSTLGVLDDAFHRVDLNSVMMHRIAFLAVGGMPDGPELWRDADAHLWRRLTDAGYFFHPVAGGPTDSKHYREDGVDEMVIAGKEPWT